MSVMTGMAWVRVLIGVLWLLAGLEKVLNQEFPGLFREVLRVGGFVKDAPPWFQGFMDASVLPNPGLFAALVGTGEVAIGVSLILGLLTNLGALGGVFLGLTFFTSLGGLTIGTGLGASGLLPLHLMLTLLALTILLSPGAKAASMDVMLAHRSPRLALLLGARGARSELSYGNLSSGGAER